MKKIPLNSLYIVWICWFHKKIIRLSVNFCRMYKGRHSLVWAKYFRNVKHMDCLASLEPSCSGIMFISILIMIIYIHLVFFSSVKDMPVIYRSIILANPLKEKKRFNIYFTQHCNNRTSMAHWVVLRNTKCSLLHSNQQPERPGRNPHSVTACPDHQDKDYRSVGTAFHGLPYLAQCQMSWWWWWKPFCLPQTATTIGLLLLHIVTTTEVFKVAFNAHIFHEYLQQ